MGKGLEKHSFSKNAEEYEKRGVSFALFCERVKRVKRERELNAETQSAQRSDGLGRRRGRADLSLRSLRGSGQAGWAFSGCERVGRNGLMRERNMKNGSTKRGGCLLLI